MDHTFNTGSSSGPEAGIPDYSPLGFPAVTVNNIDYYPFRVTDMYILPTEADQPYYHNIGEVNGNPPAGFANKAETVCGFMLYRPSATKTAAGWEISKDFALPGMHQAQFCCSASFMDNPATWLVNAQRYDDSKDFPTDSNHNTNFLAVGATDPTIEFDNALSRVTFKNLHTPRTLGAEDMPEADGQLTTTNIGDQVVKVADDKIKYGYVWKLLDTYTESDPGYPNDQDLLNGPGTNINYLLNYSIGGISIEAMYGESASTNYSSLDDMTLLTQDNWQTLFSTCSVLTMTICSQSLDFPPTFMTILKSILTIQPYDMKN